MEKSYFRRWFYFTFCLLKNEYVLEMSVVPTKYGHSRVRLSGPTRAAVVSAHREMGVESPWHSISLGGLYTERLHVNNTFSK